MKKIFMVMAAFVVSMVASAQTTLTPSYNEETKTLSFTLEDNDFDCYAVGFKFDLPEGVSVDTYYDEDDEEDKISILKGTRCKSGHSILVNETKTGYSINIYNATGTFKSDKTASICDVKLKGEAKGIVKVYSINFADKDKKSYYQDDVNYDLAGTGINAISAAKANGAIYNLAGQRVNKAQKGIFIQNGVKILK